MLSKQVNVRSEQGHSHSIQFDSCAYVTNEMRLLPRFPRSISPDSISSLRLTLVSVASADM